MFNIFAPIASLKAVRPEPSDELDCDIGRLHPHGESFCGAEAYILLAMAGIRYWRCNKALNSCRPVQKKFDILTVYSLYILECMKML
jgi:hypothetical protein